LDYPGVGPEHSYLKDTGRAEYYNVTDEEALEGMASTLHFLFFFFFFGGGSYVIFADKKKKKKNLVSIVYRICFYT
jgi:hypothetical protein